LTAIAEKLAALNTADYFQERAKRDNLEAALALMNHTRLKQPALPTPSQYSLTLGKHSPQHAAIHDLRRQNECDAGNRKFPGDAVHCPNDGLGYHRRAANGNCIAQL
jgi:hypothetical protein